MGDNVYLGDRDGVRTPMQWTGDRNGGFSRADFAQLYAPPLMDPVYGYQAVNVEAQLRTPTSLLRWLRRFIALRKEHPVFGLGTLRGARGRRTRKIFAHVRRYEDDIVLCVHNLARSAQAVELDLSRYEGRYPEEMFGRSRFPRIGELPYLLTLAPRGFFWFLLARAGGPRRCRRTTLVAQLDEERLQRVGRRPALVRRPSRARSAHVDVLDATALREDEPPLRAGARRGRASTPARTSSTRCCSACGRRRAAGSERSIARGRRPTVYDALADPALAARWPRCMRARGDARGPSDGDVALPLDRRRPSALGDAPTVRPMGVEQSNTSVVFDERLILKVFRRLEPGDNPELELLRFLTERGFANIAALARLVRVRGRPARRDARGAAGVRRRRRATAGSSRSTTSRATRGLPRRAAPSSARSPARMHTALALRRDRPRLRAGGAERRGAGAADRDDRRGDRAALPRPARRPEALEPIAGRGEEVRERLRHARRTSASAGRVIRTHGDYHLGQALLDAATAGSILDFEGEPARSLRERRRKRSPLRDVAGMLRSFAYAASAVELAARRPRPEGWEERARAAFLAGYLETVDPRLLPPGQQAIDKLLAVFELEKAVYELRYELNNRPDWVRHPGRRDRAAAGGRAHRDRADRAELTSHRPSTRRPAQPSSAPTRTARRRRRARLPPGGRARARASPTASRVELERIHPAGVFEGVVAGATLPLDYELEVDYGRRRRRSRSRDPYALPADARRARPAPRRRGPPRGALRASSARTCARSTACAARRSRSGRRPRARSAWSATSTPGTGGCTRCARSALGHLGAVRARRRRPARATSTRSARRRASCG